MVKHFGDLFVVVTQHEANGGEWSYLVQKPDTHILYPGENRDNQANWDTPELAMIDANRRVLTIQNNS